MDHAGILADISQTLWACVVELQLGRQLHLSMRSTFVLLLLGLMGNGNLGQLARICDLQP